MISNENILGESRMEETHRHMAWFSDRGWGEVRINHCWKTQSVKVWIADKVQASGQEKQETYRKVLVFWKSGEKKHDKKENRNFTDNVYLKILSGANSEQ